MAWRGQSPPVLKTAPLLEGTLSTPASSAKLAALYRSFGPIIYSRCHRALREDAAAALATQEVFLRVLDSLDQNDPRGAVQAVATACEHVCREAQSSPRRGA